MIGQASKPKPIDIIKPKHKPVLSVGQITNPKPFQASDLKPTQTYPFGMPNSKPKTLPASIGQASNPKPKHKPVYKWKHKPVYKWKPKPHQPSLTQYQTHPHSMYSSQAHPSHLFSSASSKHGGDKIDAELTLSLMEPMCTEKFLSVLDNSDASVTESVFWCFRG